LSDPGIKEAEERLAASTTGELTLKSDLAKAQARSDNRNRELIVLCVIGTYTFVVIISALYLVLCGGTEAFQNLAELLKVSVIPIVTLVIGYYFGSKSERQQ
jgi:hypothetical protein